MAAIAELVHGQGLRMWGNLLNFLAGTVLLVAVYVYSRRLRSSSAVRILSIAFLSFNAAVVGIFSQATNDGFCILFSSLAILCLDRCLSEATLRPVIGATLFAILAALSKATGWIIFAVGAASLLLKLAAASADQRRAYTTAAAVFILGFLLVVPWVDPYRHNIAERHTPFVNDEFEVPMLQVEVPRGDDWLPQIFFTFRIIELLRVPFDDDFGKPPYPLHRESLWSQVYGRALFLRFDNAIWNNPSPLLAWLGRWCLLFGLLPLSALLIGAAKLLRSLWSTAAARGLLSSVRTNDWPPLFYLGVMVSAMVVLIVNYHRQWMLFTWMKAIYFLPVIVPILRLLVEGLEWLWQRWPRLVTAWMAAAILASIIDVGWLIHDLVAGTSS
ncbi:MAG: hypothetical protein HY270_15290 [Deltaproteobacteria bacterium]|nr:hypothetical protein [Deltaproteobacteria bacterium]